VRSLLGGQGGLQGSGGFGIHDNSS